MPVLDGSGLSGSPAGHAVTDASGNSWQTISSTGTGDIQFDLGMVCTLTNVHVWNLNFYAPYNGRGANQVTIRTSTNAIDWNTVFCTEDLTVGLQWDDCTNFVSQADACIVSIPVTNAVSRMFFRVSK